MMFRSAILSVTLVAVSACTSRTTTDAGATGGGLGFTGGGTTGGGTATGGGSASTGGGATGGGTSSFFWDGGHTIDAIKGSKFCAADQVTVDNVVVTAIDSISVKANGVQASFWVADIDNPKNGIYVFKKDVYPPTTYTPKVGDVLTIIGTVQKYDATWDQFGYRVELSGACKTGGSMTFILTDAGVTPAVNMVSPPFGNSDGGNTRPNAAYGSSLVSISGPLSITNAAPVALSRIGVDGGLIGYNGFEVTGGILVANAYTFDRADGGSASSNPDGGHCDWRNVVADGGSVTFSAGITGIWDTYTHAPCIGVSNCSFNRDGGYVPGTDNGSGAANQYTYVLYPLDCTMLQP